MGRGRWLLCEREKRWKCLGEIVPIYIAIEKEKAGEVARISFFYDYYDDLWMKWFMQNYTAYSSSTS